SVVVTVRLLVALPASQSTSHLDHLPCLISGSGLGVHSRFSWFLRRRLSDCLVVEELRESASHLPCFEFHTWTLVVPLRLSVALPASQSTFHMDHLLYLIIGSGLGVHSRLSSFVRCRFLVSVLINGLPATQSPFLLLQK